MKSRRMLAWSDPGKTGSVYVVEDEILAIIDQSGRKSDGTKRFRFQEAIDGHAFMSVARPSLDMAKDDAEEGVYLRAKVLVPRLTKYIKEYEASHPHVRTRPRAR
jgi:hypothetical protein